MRTQDQIQKDIDAVNELKDDAARRLANAPAKVKMSDVVAKIVDVEYIRRHDRVTTCILKMVNGCYVEGTAFTIDAVYNVQELGDQAAYQKALQKAYDYENYLQLQNHYVAGLLKVQAGFPVKPGPLDAIYATEEADRQVFGAALDGATPTVAAPDAQENAVHDEPTV